MDQEAPRAQPSKRKSSVPVQRRQVEARTEVLCSTCSNPAEEHEWTDGWIGVLWLGQCEACHWRERGEEDGSAQSQPKPRKYPKLLVSLSKTERAESCPVAVFPLPPSQQSDMVNADTFEISLYSEDGSWSLVFPFGTFSALTYFRPFPVKAIYEAVKTRVLGLRLGEGFLELCLTASAFELQKDPEALAPSKETQPLTTILSILYPSCKTCEIERWDATWLFGKLSSRGPPLLGPIRESALDSALEHRVSSRLLPFQKAGVEVVSFWHFINSDNFFLTSFSCPASGC